MSEYRCIVCGEVKDSAKQCSCPSCGYMMFKTPYDTTKMLRNEIIRFIEGLISAKTDICPIEFLRTDDKGKTIYLSDDKNRFPSDDKIVEYIMSAAKTEDLLERMKRSAEQISEYMRSSFTAEYEADLTDIEIRYKDIYDVISKALDHMGIKTDVHMFEPLKMGLHYRNTPINELITEYDNAILLLDKLHDKISGFIKANNVYGSIDRLTVDSRCITKVKDKGERLKITGEFIQKSIDKKYIVDILSDGTEELNEMFDAYISALRSLRKTDIHEECYEYTYNEKIYTTIDDLSTAMETYAFSKNCDLIDVIRSSPVMNSAGEDRLLEYYKKMEELDVFGIMGVDPVKPALHKGEAEKKLESLIGLDNVKKNIEKIKAYVNANKAKDTLNLNMCFTGNPGTGKTVVARLVADILYENGVLSSNNVVEVSRNDLVAAYVGQTAIKTMDAVDSAMGGVLFIDEAYSLVADDTPGDYGHEAVAALIKAMEDRRGEFCVILAGYKNKTEKMISDNPGFKSRIQFFIDFPNYSDDELRSITKLMLKEREYTISEDAMNRITDILSFKRKEPEFANAREVRNILDQVIMCTNLRGAQDGEIELRDVNTYINDSGICLPSQKNNIKKALTGEEELDQLIGLEHIKRTVKKIKAYSKKNRNADDFNIHMCFYGAPGTGKTEVARILSRILYDAGVLNEAKLVETDANGLISKYMGGIADKTKEKIESAMGGVLFIDEAYALTEGGDGSTYGEEAIAVLLKEMEDKRGRICVILAGYREQMKAMIAKNPGFDSRIQFKLDFPDYSSDEIRQLAGYFLSKQGYDMTDDAMVLFLSLAEYYRRTPDFANARTVRNLLDQIIMNQNLRTEENDGDMSIIKADVEDYISDEEIDLSSENKGKKIGFI